MKVAEIYRSIQGEGFLTGTPSAFVRASGCNLRCWFCDTPHASWSPEGEEMSVGEIVSRVLEFDCRHVVLTGGEPMLFGELVSLTSDLKRCGCHLTIETAGTVYQAVQCDLMSISPKLAGSGPGLDRHAGWHERHERARHAPAVIRRLIAEFPFQVKFVIDSPDDCRSAEAYLAELPEIDRSRVLLMPQGTDPEALSTKAEWLEEYCDRHSLRFCPRRQIEWFGFVRGT